MWEINVQRGRDNKQNKALNFAKEKASNVSFVFIINKLRAWGVNILMPVSHYLMLGRPFPRQYFVALSRPY